MVTVQSQGHSLNDALRAAEQRLGEAGVPSPRVDAELLAAHVLGLTRGQLALRRASGSRAETALDDQASSVLAELIDERCRRTPVQHLTGRAPFRQLELRVGPGVFIPRPETEQVAEVAIRHIQQLEGEASERRAPRVIDLGTGSGALAASIASECPAAEVHAVELSEQALAWARANLEDHGVHLHQGDLAALPAAWDGGFDVVVSNPPYIPESMVPREQEVRDHDPELALYGGDETGLKIPYQVIAAAQRLLRPGGWFIMEHAEVQAAALVEHCRNAGRLTDVRTHQDLSGRDRALSGFLAADPRADREPSAEEPLGVGEWRS